LICISTDTCIFCMHEWSCASKSCQLSAKGSLERCMLVGSGLRQFLAHLSEAETGWLHRRTPFLESTAWYGLRAVKSAKETQPFQDGIGQLVFLPFRFNCTER
jgi:hypothetical protein